MQHWHNSRDKNSRRKNNNLQGLVSLSVKIENIDRYIQRISQKSHVFQVRINYGDVAHMKNECEKDYDEGIKDQIFYPENNQYKNKWNSYEE